MKRNCKSAVRVSAIEIEELTVQVIRKPIRTLRLMVNARGEVRVSAPLRSSERAIRSLVQNKIDWIRHHLKRWEAVTPELELQLVSGEQHLFMGQRYRLEVEEQLGPGRVVLLDGVMHLQGRLLANRERRERILANWYRTQLEEMIPPLLDLWQPRIGVQVSDWSIRHMRSRWGSCHPTRGRILLSLELAKRPHSCLEYVLVHELVHLLEASHNSRFWGFMDQFLPEWRVQRDLLNKLPPI
jgi:predicted metal-dependent hydrolase